MTNIPVPDFKGFMEMVKRQGHYTRTRTDESWMLFGYDNKFLGYKTIYKDTQEEIIFPAYWVSHQNGWPLDTEIKEVTL